MNNILYNLLILFSFFFLSYFVQQFLIPKLRKSFLDNPNNRSSHKKPVPGGGGIVFASLGTLGAIYFNFYIPLICFPLSLVGFLDDKFNISRKLRYLVQIATVFFIIEQSPLKIENSNTFIAFFISLFLIFSLSAIINFVNFMDGIDGLVAGTMIIYFSIFTILFTTATLPLIGCLLAFLVFNWHPAKLFMGDTGSTYLGALFGGMILQSSSWYDFLAFIFIASPLLADAFVCVIRRFLGGENIFEPHKKHLYQRLANKKGFSHSKVSSIYIFMSIIFALSWLFHGLSLLLINFIFMIIIGIYLDRFIAEPF